MTHPVQWRIQRGAAGAGSPSPMEIGAPVPKEQGRLGRREMKIAAGNENTRPCTEGAGAPIFVSIRRVSQSCLIFTPKELYECLPTSKVALLIRKGAIFAHDGNALRRYAAPLYSRDALLSRKKTPFRL